jgi:hypothetical protein
MTCGT